MKKIPKPRREWLVTNKIGGYASMNTDEENSRKYHGLLIASFHAPTDRCMIWQNMTEKAFGDIIRYDFSYDYYPVMTACVNGLTVRKKIAMENEKNTTGLTYDFTSESENHVILTPEFNFRDHHAVNSPDKLKFECTVKEDENGACLCLVPESAKDVRILFCVSGQAKFIPRTSRISDKKILMTEIETGMEGEDYSYIPYDIDLTVPAGESSAGIVCTVEKECSKDAASIIEDAGKYGMNLRKKAGFKSEILNKLVTSSDTFITKRESTGGKTVLAGFPWFTDWGRDTMIALTGLTLCTGRFEDAKEILKTFVYYEKDGILPNMFPDRNEAPLYNTADASLWFFFCVYKYLEYTKDEKEYEYVCREIYPCMKRIIAAYENGTDFSIHMDTDGLIHAGSELDQITWMDVRFDDVVVTPRHGKPVEINALWYNALSVTKLLSERFGDREETEHTKRLLSLVEGSFEKRFWNAEKGCLFDVVDEIKDGKIRQNAQIRPNQIYAVSLPFTCLSKEKEKAVFDTVHEKLFAGVGLRSLACEDAEYHGFYVGQLHDRDRAYHQGTAWGFLLGGYITAYFKVYGNDNKTREIMKDRLSDFTAYIDAQGGTGNFAEIFDGDEPHFSRGCYNQAWSVGEMIRALCESGVYE